MTVLEILITLIAAINLVLSCFVMFPLHQPTTVPMWLIKVVVCAISPVLLLTGILIAIAAALLNFLPALGIASLSAIPYLIYVLQSTRPPETSSGFETAFGRLWKTGITAERKPFMLQKRFVFILTKSPDPILSQNIKFYAIPGTNRQLLCDLWQPSEKRNRSGLAFIYLHGSAWTHLDKDFGTRPFFRHLANQGHVIMDVAYRLFPETDFMGMVHDTKHAVAWMKQNAAELGVNQESIVIGGGSAGAHLALLAAYTDKTDQLTPADLQNSDLKVRGVISLYGQSDLAATYYHTCQHLVKHSALSQKKDNGATAMTGWMKKRMGASFQRLGFDKKVEPGMLDPMLGGNPDEKPDAYALFSPITYVDENCPATLFIHGEHDILAPLNAIRHLYTGLANAGVPVVLHSIPKTDHAFDLILPGISPSAQNAIYDVERFLALMESKDQLITEQNFK